MEIFQGWDSQVTRKTRSRSLAQRLFLNALRLALLTGCLLVILERSENYLVRYELVAIRESLLTRFTDTPELLEASPQELLRSGFNHDRPELIAEFRARLVRSPHYAQALPAIDATHDGIKKAQRIVLSFSAGGNHASIYRLPLLDKMQRTFKGDGICSDHSEIFLAMAAACGLWAREVQNDIHSFAEFYSITQRKWIYIDPMLAIMATDERGTYLSSTEIRERRLHNRPVTYVFFGTAPGHLKSTADHVFQVFYGSPARFYRIALAEGNNVLGEDRFQRALSWVPWELQKALAILSGVHPHVVCLADRYNRQEVHAVQTLRTTVLICGSGYAICLLLYPCQGLFRLTARVTRRFVRGRGPISSFQSALLR